MIRNDIDWDKIRELYASNGIAIINIPIKDRDPRKIKNYCSLATSAIRALKLLKDKFEVNKAIIISY